MQKFMDADKRMSARQAVERFVKDGDSFVFANCLYCMPLALTHELIRQGKKNLMAFQQGGIEEIDQLLWSEVIDRLVIAYNFRAGGPRIISPLDRAIKDGKVVVEEMTNHTLLSMMKAGAMGYPFMPVLPGISRTDVVRRKGFMGDQRFAEIKDPFTGQDMLVVKGYNPDFALMHVQRADKAGNGQLWGAMINSKWAALASRKVILTCEEIVDTEVIMSSPHLTIVPAHKVCAVVECPWGAHPSEVLGHYDYDFPFRVLFVGSTSNPDTAKAWFNDWIYNVPDREAYIRQYINRFGQDTLDAFRAKPFKSVPADYGSTFSLDWDEQGYSKNMGVTMEEFIAMLGQKGALIDGN
ncbi:MAG: CoA-transferase [Syntrophales bacterium]|jgi:glutaconate CoA-transferase subunit A